MTMKEKPTNDDKIAAQLFGTARPVKIAREVDPLPHPSGLWRSLEQNDVMSVSRFYCSNCGHIIRITDDAVRTLSELADIPVPSLADLERTYYLVRACLLCSDHYEAPRLLDIPKQ